MKQRNYLDDLPPALPPNGNSGKPPHDFRRSLAAAEGGHYNPFWEEAYCRAFPGLVACVSLQGNTASQQQGKDRIIHLPNGQTLYIQEKIRPTRRTDIDIAIEYEHRFTNGTTKPGWIAIDQDIHFLMTAFPDTQKCDRRRLAAYLGDAQLMIFFEAVNLQLHDLQHYLKINNQFDGYENVDEAAQTTINQKGQALINALRAWKRSSASRG